MASCTCSAAAMSVGASSHRRVESSMSVTRNVTVPPGRCTAMAEPYARTASSAREVRRQLDDEVLRVSATAIDEARLPPAEEGHADHVHPRRIDDDAAVMAHHPLGVEHRHIEP